MTIIRNAYNSVNNECERCSTSAYHSAAVVHVVDVFVSMGAEVHAGRDPGEGAPLPQTQPAVGACLLLIHLAHTNAHTPAHTHTHTHTEGEVICVSSCQHQVRGPAHTG